MNIRMTLYGYDMTGYDNFMLGYWIILSEYRTSTP